MSSQVSTTERIEAGLKPTLMSIEYDLNESDDWECLYFASEEQIDKLINQGRIDEDFGSRHQNYQEELRCMLNEASVEFS